MKWQGASRVQDRELPLGIGTVLLAHSEWPTETPGSDLKFLEANQKLPLITGSCLQELLGAILRSAEVKRVGCWPSVIQKRLPGCPSKAL